MAEIMYAYSFEQGGQATISSAVLKRFLRIHGVRRVCLGAQSDELREHPCLGLGPKDLPMPIALQISSARPLGNP